MACVVHVVPVGHTRETLIYSLRRFPVDKVVLVLGRSIDAEGEKKAREVAVRLRKDLGSIPSEVMELDLDNVHAVALAVADRIYNERAKGFEVLINLSGSLRSAGIGCYVAALYTRTPAYIGLPDYRGGRVSGVRDIVYVPLPPLKEIFGDKKEILCMLEEAGGSLYLSDLMRKGKNLQDKLAERSRLSYHISDLKKYGLVEAVKEGKKLKISLTLAGRLYIKNKTLP